MSELQDNPLRELNNARNLPRDTPETDDLARGNHVVPTEFAQDLERQLRKVRDTVHRLRKQRAIARAYGEQMERERDEAKDDLEFRRELYRVQEKYLELARRERDEAIAEAKKLDGAYEDATNYYARWSELIEERDEARGEAVRYRSLYYVQLGIDASASWFPWEAKP